MYSASVDGVDDQGLVPETLSSEELESFIQAMYQSNKTVSAENDLLETYLANTDPILVENMDSILDAATAAIHKAERTVQLGVMAAVTTRQQESTATTPRSSGHSNTGGSSAKVAAFTLSDKGPKIQPSQKMEIIQRELDHLKSSFDEEKRAIDKAMFILQCKKSASTLRLREIEIIRKNLEDNLSKEWIDERTQNVAGEKMITYFEQRIKYDLQQIKAFITRRKNLRIQFDASNLKLKQLGEELKYVDYEKLLIEYKDAQKQLASEMEKLTELKEANTTYQVALNNYRSVIRKHNYESSSKKEKIELMEEKIKYLLHDESYTVNDFINRQKNVDRNTKLITKYTEFPQIMEYIKHKRDKYDLKIALQVALRKKRVNRIKKAKRISLQIPKITKHEGNKTYDDFCLFSAPPSPKVV